MKRLVIVHITTCHVIYLESHNRSAPCWLSILPHNESFKFANHWRPDLKMSRNQISESSNATGRYKSRSDGLCFSRTQYKQCQETWKMRPESCALAERSSTSLSYNAMHTLIMKAFP